MALGDVTLDLEGYPGALRLSPTSGGWNVYILGNRTGEIRGAGGHIECALAGALPTGGPVEVGTDGYLIWRKE